MKHRLVSHSLLLLGVFLALVPIALASSTWYVDGVNGNDNNNCKSTQTACKTIGHAISLASSGDSIMVAAAVYNENLTIGLSLKIVGSGAKTTIIDGGGHNLVINIPSSARVGLSGVTIQHGRGGIASSGMLTLNSSIITRNSARACAGINNGGTLTINDSTISRNLAWDFYNTWAGGFCNSGSLTVNNSTISRNGAGATSYVYGGGVYNTGTLTVNNSTLYANSAGALGIGGGIFNDGGMLMLNNSTLSQNYATGSGGSGSGGGIAGPTTLQNTIVSKNHGGNCYPIMTSNGYNLSSDDTCKFHNTGDLNNIRPLLGLLQDNGGPTQTMALLPGSPAIDAGNPSGCTDSQGHILKTDQRGKPRPDKEDIGGCDMGAYERQKD